MSEEHRAGDRGRHCAEGEPADQRPAQVVAVEPDPGTVAEQLGDGQHRDGESQPEHDGEHGQQQHTAAESGDCGQHGQTERGQRGKEQVHPELIKHRVTMA